MKFTTIYLCYYFVVLPLSIAITVALRLGQYIYFAINLYTKKIKLLIFTTLLKVKQRRHHSLVSVFFSLHDSLHKQNDLQLILCVR